MIGFQIFHGVIYFYALFELVHVWNLTPANAFFLGAGTLLFYGIVFLFWEWKLSQDKDDNDDL